LCSHRRDKPDCGVIHDRVINGSGFVVAPAKKIAKNFTSSRANEPALRAIYSGSKSGSDLAKKTLMFMGLLGRFLLLGKNDGAGGLLDLSFRGLDPTALLFGVVVRDLI
jgi:hypothetical protein